MPGYSLEFNSLGIINGIIDEAVQVGSYYEFAVNKAYNDTVYSYAKFAKIMSGGCQDLILYCRVYAEDLRGKHIYEYHLNRPVADVLPPAVDSLCAEAGNMCRDNVEGLYYNYGGRGVYDIRHPYADPTPSHSFVDWLNIESTQRALGVTVNYTDGDNAIYWSFQNTGDFIYPNFLLDLNHLLTEKVRVSLAYGDADYICNWFGGEKISLAVDYPHSAQFAAQGYAPMMVNGKEYGETREYGNFSFTRVYESGHEVPYYQPLASLQWFNRTLYHWDIATGSKKVTPRLGTSGPANATHTEPFVPVKTVLYTDYPIGLPTKTRTKTKTSTAT